ncbi:MAG: tyrosine-type recombinase/integrase [Deltaproteobacteria bacterium]|nr:tyrosine-type recombinase/integrase [Desulfitobacteriaceae bacterium]MDI6854839.1 tyrosine-type recombinase/integrase [Deltaproteobacteria bacterium]
MKLTDRQIKNLKPRLDRYEVFEDRGFGIRVAPTGRKTFIYLYRMPGEPKKRRLTIGTYPKMTLAEAHRKYAEAKEMVAQGIDPGSKTVTERAEERKAPNLATLANEYVEKWAKPRKRSWKEDKRILEKDILPSWGQRKAKDITRRDIIRLLDGIVDRGAGIMANRTLAVIRKMFNFAVSRDIVPVSPCLAVRAPAPEQRRDRVLTTDEIRALWHGLEGAKMMAEGTKLALKLQLVTAQRKAEIVTAAWEEIDFTDKWWTIPPEKAKNKMAHRVPLSSLALELLQAAKNLAGESPWVFPSPQTERHITPEAVDHALRRPGLEALGFTFVPHDLRRTAASHMTGMGISRLVVSKILNHVERGVTAVYDRHSYDREKRQALEAWGRKIQEVVGISEEMSNVIPIR